jgi:hypothetical protein
LEICSERTKREGRPANPISETTVRSSEIYTKGSHIEGSSKIYSERSYTEGRPEIHTEGCRREERRSLRGEEDHVSKRSDQKPATTEQNKPAAKAKREERSSTRSQDQGKKYEKPNARARKQRKERRSLREGRSLS